MTSILIADDHAILRRGLKQILSDEWAALHFGEAVDSAQALTLLVQEPWDILILDINMPGRGGFEVLDEVRRNFRSTPVLVLSSTPEDQIGIRAIKNGAAGYLNKQAAADQLVTAVKQILAGEQFISPLLAHKLVVELRRGTDRPRHEALSDREMQVSLLTVAGKSIKDIAAELSLSVKTISTFRGRAFEKLGVKNDAELVRYMRDNNLG
jgi:two-component system invasion response regulator UvrY